MFGEQRLETTHLGKSSGWGPGGSGMGLGAQLVERRLEGHMKM